MLEFKSDAIEHVSSAKMSHLFAAVKVLMKRTFFAFSPFLFLLMGAVVIMDLKDYFNEAHRQLNKDHYKKLNKDTTTTNAKLINNTIQSLKKRNHSKKKSQMA